MSDIPLRASGLRGPHQGKRPWSFFLSHFLCTQVHLAGPRSGDTTRINASRKLSPGTEELPWAEEKQTTWAACREDLRAGCQSG